MSSPALVSMALEGKVATITMQRQPVNSLNLDLFQDLSKSIKKAEDNPQVQALVLTSSCSTFSAGLDLTELYQPEKSRLREFWTAFQQLYLDLYGSRLACIAAINGHAPAAGCMLALSCDYRILKPKAIIGLNETQFGLSAPPFMANQMIDTIGRRSGELALTRGTLFSHEEALQLGLVDDVAEDVMERAKAVADEWAQIPSMGRVRTKDIVRGKAIEELETTREEDLESFVDMVVHPTTQAGLGAYLQSLKK